MKVDSETICNKCHAGIMEQYRKIMKRGEREVSIMGRKCSRCGYINLDDEDDVWSIVGL